MSTSSGCHSNQTSPKDFWKFFIYNRFHTDTGIWNIYLLTSLYLLSYLPIAVPRIHQRRGLLGLTKSGHPSPNKITTGVESNHPAASALFVSFSSRPRHHLNISPPSTSSPSVVGCAARLKEGAWLALGFDYSQIFLVLGRGNNKRKDIGSC